MNCVPGRENDGIVLKKSVFHFILYLSGLICIDVVLIFKFLFYLWNRTFSPPSGSLPKHA